MSDWLITHRGILRRGAVFIAGGLISYGLNLLPYKLLRNLAGWSHDSAYAVSLTWVTVLMFFWNYRVNFPTPKHWKQCAWRYSFVVLAMWAVNFGFVRVTKSLLPVAGAIFFVGFIVAAFKFAIYHWWVFPFRPVDEIVEEGL